MPKSPTFVMKRYLFLTTTLLSLFFFGCEKEVITPQSNDAPELTLSTEGHIRPTVQCGSSSYTTFKNGTTPYGSVEILNNSEQLFILTDMNNGWLLESVKIFAGNTVNLPKGFGGTIELEEFPFQMIHPRRVDKYTYTLPVASLPTCFGVTIWAKAAQVNMFGQVTNRVDLWANGAAVLNGFSFQYCKGSCFMNNNSNQSDI